MKLTTHLHLVPRPKNEWRYISIPQYVFMAWCLVKYRNNFTFTFFIEKWLKSDAGSIKRLISQFNSQDDLKYRESFTKHWDTEQIRDV
jgi:hypothetical protein